MDGVFTLMWLEQQIYSDEVNQYDVTEVWLPVLYAMDQPVVSWSPLNGQESM